MTLGRCPLSIFCSRGKPPREVLPSGPASLNVCENRVHCEILLAQVGENCPFGSLRSPQKGLPTETKVESGTSRSKSGTSLESRNSGCLAPLCAALESSGGKDCFCATAALREGCTRLFLGPLECAGAHWNPATCGANRGD